MQSRNLGPAEELKNCKRSELADIFIFLTYISEEYQSIGLKKLKARFAQNAAKYPVAGCFRD